MRREDQVTVQGPVKEQQPDGMSRRGVVFDWGRCCYGACAVPILGASGDPPGDTCNRQEASREDQKLPRRLRDSLASIKKKPSDDRCCACASAFLGFDGLFGWVHLGMVPW